jgi:hypothetical protein
MEVMGLFGKARKCLVFFGSHYDKKKASEEA